MFVLHNALKNYNLQTQFISISGSSEFHLHHLIVTSAFYTNKHLVVQIKPVILAMNTVPKNHDFIPGIILMLHDLSMI